MRKRLLFLAAGLTGVALVFCTGALLGLLIGDSAAKQRRFSYEQGIIGPVLSSDPSFTDLKIMMYTGDGSAYLVGEVMTESDLERLRSMMSRLLGEAREVPPLAGVESRRVGTAHRQ